MLRSVSSSTPSSNSTLRVGIIIRVHSKALTSPPAWNQNYIESLRTEMIQGLNSYKHQLAASISAHLSIGIEGGNKRVDYMIAFVGELFLFAPTSKVHG